MPSPIAHAFAGAAVHAGLTRGSAAPRDWRPWALAVAAGMAADLDFLPGLLVGDPSRYHHGPTHSLLAVLVFTLLAAPLASPALGGRTRAVVLVAGAYASHLALDLVTVHQPVRPGIPLFWPFADALVLAPVQLFADVHHGATWRAFVNWHNVAAVGREVALVGAPVTLLCALRLRRARGPGQAARASRVTAGVP